MFFPNFEAMIFANVVFQKPLSHENKICPRVSFLFFALKIADCNIFFTSSCHIKSVKSTGLTVELSSCWIGADITFIGC
jgi:hypothetical protein